MFSHNAFLKFVLMLFLTFILSTISAQNSKLVNVSYAPKEDSAYFEKMQKYMAEIRKTRPTVALVLAGGGAKGAAHIGVLKYIEEIGIPIDFVAGTSMGGLIGGLYSLGYSAKEIDSIVCAIDWNVMMSDKIPMEFYSYNRKLLKSTYLLDIPFDGTHFKNSLPSGFLYGLNIYNLLSALSVGYQQEMDFMDLPTPYCCVATEIVSQTEKHWCKGPLIEAMRSTMSIPGYFRPVRIDSMILSDGGTKNNFPTDVAKAAGADIIIGVEMTMPRDYTKVNNIADILIQTAQYSGGLEAHNNNVKNATIYITPDISGYKTFSFGKEEIITLIERGYSEAKKHSAAFDSISRIVGKDGRKFYNKKAINTTNTAVKLSSVEYHGIDEKEMQYLNQKIRMHSGEFYDRCDFEISQSIIYGTMAFSSVTYKLLKDTADSYKLVFNCEKRPKNSLNIGLRADTEQWLAALINFGFGKNKIYGSSFDIGLKLSISPYINLQWTYKPIKGPNFGASLLLQYRTVYGMESLAFSKNYYYEQSWRNMLNTYISIAHWSRVDLRFGVRVEHMPFVRFFSEEGFDRTDNWNKFYPYAYMRFVFDNEDDKYIPNKGLCVKASYDYDFRNTHFIATGIHGVIPVSRYFSILSALRGRYIFGNPNKYGYMDNYVGYIREGKYYEHQLPFFGINGEIYCKELLSVVDLDLRFRVHKDMYLSAIAAALHDGDMVNMNPHAIYAAGVQFAYKTKFGPILANIHWCSNKNKIGAHISAGFDF